MAKLSEQAVIKAQQPRVDLRKAGFIYIMSDPAFHGLLEIGKSNSSIKTDYRLIRDPML